MPLPDVAHTEVVRSPGAAKRSWRRGVDRHRTRAGGALDMSGRWAVTRLVVQFTLVGIAALAVVGLATQVASQRVGQREAISDTRTTTLVKAQGLVEPAITEV
jgi:hypothetical protein